MSKMVKLSDAVGYSLSKRAEEDNLSLAGEVAKLLAITETPPHPTDTEYFDKKFDELKALIEDTTVDRLAGSGGPRSSYAQSNVKVYVPWDTAHELLYEFLPEDAPEFIGNASEQIRQADNEFPVFIQDDKLWTEDYYGTKTPILSISPRVTQFLESHK